MATVDHGDQRLLRVRHRGPRHVRGRRRRRPATRQRRVAASSSTAPAAIVRPRRARLTLPTVVVPRLATFRITVDAGGGAGRRRRSRRSSPGRHDRRPGGDERRRPASTSSSIPGASYRFTITSPNGFVPRTVPATAQQPAVGAHRPADGDDGRSARSPAPSPGPRPASRCGVRPATTPATITGTVTGSSYTITRVPNGTWTVEAAALRRRPRRERRARTVESTTGSLTGIGVTLGPRPVTDPASRSPPATATVALTGRVDETGPATGRLTELHPPRERVPRDLDGDRRRLQSPRAARSTCRRRRPIRSPPRCR